MRPGEAPKTIDPARAPAAAPPAPPRARTLALAGLAVAAGLGGLLTAGVAPRLRREAAFAREAERERTALPRVRVVRPRPAARTEEVALPGSIQAREEAAIYARTSGYLRRRLVDIGDGVAPGELLAEIETPEVDQELAQATATVEQLRAKLAGAETSLDLAQSSFVRHKAVFDGGASTAQELAERQAALEAAHAAVAGAKADIVAGDANLGRLRQLKSFAQVVAPFGGTITERNIEIGDLVTAGTGSGRALFRVAYTDVVRLFVHVPQAFAPAVRTGTAAAVSVREFRTRDFPGRVVRTAGALDPASRTLLTEIHVANADHVLLPGMFARARIELAREAPPLLVPAGALLVTAEGTRVVLVDGGGRVRFRRVEVEDDYGSEIGIASGLAAEDRIVLGPSERLREGAAVEIVDEPGGAAPTRGGP
jgi:RND family efflux transporter MFP subunit